MFALEDQLEDVDHGEEIQAFTNPIIEEEDGGASRRTVVEWWEVEQV
jgi:hypothetical protein